MESPPTALLLVACLLTACGSDSKRGATDGGGAGTGAEAGAAGGVDTLCDANATEACDCDAAALGSRRCTPDGRTWSRCDCSVYGAEFAVSPEGSDAAAGDLQAPFATLEAARTAVAELANDGLPEGGVVVWLRGGDYELEASFALGPADSGDSGRPIVYRGYPGEHVSLLGARAVEPSGFEAISRASSMWDRLDEESREKILQLDLAAEGIADYGELQRRGFCGSASSSGLELFINGQPMTLARWPDAGQDDPLPGGQSEELEIFGELSPEVTGRFVRNGEQDGVSAFAREGLVDGLQFYLYRRTWEFEGTMHTAWFLTTDETGYPTSNGPWWYVYSNTLAPMDASNGASGTPSAVPPDAITQGFARIAGSDSDTVWQYASARPERWLDTSAVWFHGYWMYPWADCRQASASLETATRTVTFDEAPGYGIAPGMFYYAFNLPEEITQPGEWYLDRAAGMLYLYPPPGFDEARVLLSMVAEPLVHLSEAKHIELRDITIEASRGPLVRIDGGADNVLAGVTLRNGGGDAARISGQRNGLTHCLVSGVANGGVILEGGERPSLTAGENYVENSHFHDFGRIEWTYRPAVKLSGVGQRAAHNLIHDAPHAAILFGDNDHRIEFNEIHHVAQFASDVGAIYGGRDWGARGNVIGNNFIHHLASAFPGAGVHGIYLDDCLSGIEVSGNIFYEIQDSGILHGGGRDNLIVNNLVARCGAALAADSRGYDWLPDRGLNNTPGSSWNLLEKLQAVGYQDEPWASRYPECAAIPNDWEAIIAEGSTWPYPEGSVFSRNIGWNNGSFIRGASSLDHYAAVEDNLEDSDPHFVDQDALNLTLAADSPALSIPGFEAIPFGEIGIEAD